MKQVQPTIGLLPIACSRFRGMGKETPKTYEERIQLRLDEIKKQCSEFAVVVDPGQIYSRDDVQKAMDLFYAGKVDCVFAFFLSWSEDAAWIRFLRDMYPIPLYYAHITPAITYTNTEGENEFIEYLSTGGLVGTLEGSGSFKRFDRPMSFSGCGDLCSVMKEVKSFAYAAALRTDLRNATFALIAQYPEIMWATYCDPYTYFSKIGPELRFVSVATLKDAYDAVSDQRVDACIDMLMKKYPVREKLAMEHFKASVRCSLALEDVMRAKGATMGILNDGSSVLFEQIGLRPGFYPTPENEGEIGIVPEGDLGVGLAVYIALRLTGKHANIIEPAYIENDGRVKVVHAGPNDYTDPQGKTIIARDIRFARSKWKHAGAPFAWYVIPAGPKTLIHCSQGKDGVYKMITVKAQGMEMQHELASYSHGCITFPGRDPNEVFAALINEGVTQHYALVEGDCRKEVRYLAGMLGFVYKDL